MTKINNTEARQHVWNKEEFTNKTETMYAKLYGGHPEQRIPPLYVVYSYGEHFPMYVYDYEACQWLGNQDKYSRTTTKHQQLTRPNTVVQWFDTETLKRIARCGLVNAVAHRMSY